MEQVPNMQQHIAMEQVKQCGKNIFLNVSKTGDATREMVGMYYAVWNEDVSCSVYSVGCFAVRGGLGSNGTMSGIFSAAGDKGGVDEIYHSFRTVLAPSESV